MRQSNIIIQFIKWQGGTSEVNLCVLIGFFLCQDFPIELTIFLFFECHIYSLRHRKCGVRGFIHELFVSKPERARYERVRAFDTNNE